MLFDWDIQKSADTVNAVLLHVNYSVPFFKVAVFCAESGNNSRARFFKKINLDCKSAATRVAKLSLALVTDR